jgi:hypothetical protein
MGRHLLEGRMDQIIARRDRLGRHGAAGGAPSGASASRSNSADPINMLPIPSASAW